MSAVGKRVNAILTIAAVGALAVGAGLMALFPSAGRLASVGREFEFPSKLLDAHLYTIERRENGVNMVSDGTLGRRLEADGRFWQAAFEVSVREEFYSLPGPRGNTSFRLDRVTHDGVDISFKTQQRSRDGGNSLETIDRGILHLQWRANQTPYALPTRPPAQ